MRIGNLSEFVDSIREQNYFPQRSLNKSSEIGPIHWLDYALLRVVISSQLLCSRVTGHLPFVPLVVASFRHYKARAQS
jgi:hypothetical protein